SAAARAWSPSRFRSDGGGSPASAARPGRRPVAGRGASTLQRPEALDEAGVAATAGDAKAQLARYLADERLARQFPGVRFTGLVVVFHGWELAYCEAVTPSRLAPVD
ncbi:MAG: hypothetical protein OXC31_13520, partial [Spirochaetaceae bacterium]|nr:hypothetical protein [Spirochaetaceae bacterium]